VCADFVHVRYVSYVYQSVYCVRLGGSKVRKQQFSEVMFIVRTQPIAKQLATEKL